MYIYILRLANYFESKYYDLSYNNYNFTFSKQPLCMLCTELIDILSSYSTLNPNNYTSLHC